MKFLLAAVLVAALLHLPVPVTSAFRRALLERSDGVADSSAFQIRSARVSLAGGLFLREVALPGPGVSARRIRVQISRLGLLRGRIEPVRVQAEDVRLDLGRALGFLANCQDASRCLETLGRRGGRSGPVTGMPLEELSFRWRGQSGGGRIEALEIRCWGGRLTGNFRLRDTGGFAGEGTLRIEDLQLGKMMAVEKRRHQRARGAVSGSLALQLTPGKGLTGQGGLVAGGVHLEGFSFQDHFALRTYLPDLKVLRFHRVRVGEVRLGRSGLTLDAIRGVGDPLLFQGKGRILPGGNFSFSLECALDGGYCRDLPPLARDGMNLEKDGDCRFSSGLSGDARWQSLDLAAVYGTAVGRGMDRAVGGILGLFE